MPKLSVPTLHAEMRAEAAIRNSEPEPPLSLVGQLSRSWSPTASGEGRCRRHGGGRRWTAAQHSDAFYRASRDGMPVATALTS